MSFKHILWIGIGLILVSVIYSCASSSVKRLTLFKGRVYPWEIVYVQEKKFPRGTFHHYEVFYADRRLVIPKEIFGSRANISEFVAASGFEVQHDQHGMILITMRNLTDGDDGRIDYQFVSFFLAKINDGNPEPNFWIYTLEQDKIGEFQLKN